MLLKDPVKWSENKKAQKYPWIPRGHQHWELDQLQKLKRGSLIYPFFVLELFVEVHA